MTKLKKCLDLLEKANSESPGYSIGSAQDIEEGRKELKLLSAMWAYYEMGNLSECN